MCLLICVHETRASVHEICVCECCLLYGRLCLKYFYKCFCWNELDVHMRMSLKYMCECA